MKKTFFAISILASAALLYADYYSSYFPSVYKTSSGARGFASVQNYSTNGSDYFLSFADNDRGVTFNNPQTFLSYRQNLRMFIPAFAKSYSFYALSYTGTYNMDVIYSLGSVPSLANALPKASSVDTSAYVAESKTNSYYDTDMKGNSATLSSPYWLINGNTMHNSLSKGDLLIAASNIDRDLSVKGLNKWLYIATNTVEPTLRELKEKGILPTTAIESVSVGGTSTSITSAAPSAYYPSYIAMSTSIALYKDLVDKYVLDNLSQRLNNQSDACARQADDVKKLCVYITSFGDDGEDLYDSTHINTAKYFAGSNTTNTVTLPAGSTTSLAINNAVSYTGSANGVEVNGSNGNILVSKSAVVGSSAKIIATDSSGKTVTTTVNVCSIEPASAINIAAGGSGSVAAKWGCAAFDKSITYKLATDNTTIRVDSNGLVSIDSNAVVGSKVTVQATDAKYSQNIVETVITVVDKQDCNQAIMSQVLKTSQWYMFGVGKESGCTISGLKSGGASLVYKWSGDINNYETTPDAITNFQGFWLKK